jgi:hypothetical protein
LSLLKSNSRRIVELEGVGDSLAKKSHKLIGPMIGVKVRNIKLRWKRYRAGIPMSVKPTGRTIDMTKPTWGWSLWKWDFDKVTETVRTGGWCYPRPMVGDRIQTVEGQGPVIVLAVEYCRDPDDMWFATVGIE